ncbi:hypothetical protein [Pseudooceanicola onchidii]|uniref:hypothetical protein n=1 Tax=Pseudooceanicola onchidii TaxID=2562279 RepID=UPI0010AA5252|nr:hypothetical protein [Pseudooceanicola onchidii]
MDSDLIMVAGLGLLILSIPSAVAAFADGRRPYVALSVVLAGAGVLGWGWVHHPEEMTVAELPHVIFRVLARVIP